jgi:N6-L-threonylcarbamoyladenine synthase/protein kinase Bud32
MEKIISRGAEAVLYLSKGELVKERIKKGYRVAEIDEKLRRVRTKGEASLLSKASRAGVLTPGVREVEKFSIRMEFLEGERVKEALEKGSSGIYEKIGEIVGKLHSSNIVHGDLTTSNMILKGEKLYLIDFGLGRMTNRVEDFAVDLLLLYEAFRSTHFPLLEEAWKAILKAYTQEYAHAGDVIKRMEKIKKRRRYT